MTINITGGQVTFARTVKVSDYEPKKAEVVFHFTVPDGEAFEEVDFNRIAALAKAKAEELLGFTPGPSPLETKTPPKKPGRPPKVAPEIDEIEVNPVTAPTKSSQAGKKVEEDWESVSEEAPTISDKDLSDALTARQGVLKNAPIIKGLVAAFAGVDKRAAEIPQEKRADFLEKLKALKNPG